MSCFQVADNHISAIIGYACRANLNAGWVGNPGRYVYRPGQEQETFNILYEANARSVNARYTSDKGLTGGTYQADAPRLSAIEAIKAIDGLAYQCDEWEGYEGSEADLFLKAVKQSAVRCLPGYDKARWSIE